MKDKSKTLFELKSRMTNLYEKSGMYKYYSKLFESRKNLLSLLSYGTPFFQEIKGKTENIQEILKDSGYKNINGLLKSLFIGGIEFFLNNNVNDVSVYDDNHIDDYYLGLFSGLHIDINDKNFLKEILSELKKSGEKLPENPIEFLIKYNYEEKNRENLKTDESTEQPNSKFEKTKMNLDSILRDFHDKDYGFIKDLRKVGVPEERLDYTFLVGLYDDICNLLDGKNVSQGAIDKIFSYYNIDISNKILLRSLKDEIEKSQILQINNSENRNFSRYQKEIEETERLLFEVAEKKEKLMNKNNRLKGKIILRGHSAYNDTPEGVKLHGENLILYNVGDEYIPCDNHANSIEKVNFINQANQNDLEEAYLRKNHESLDFWKNVVHKNDYEGYILFLKQILFIETVDLIGMYDNGDRFEVVKSTYMDKEPRDGEEITCWYVDIRSKKTGQVYRALSH